MTEVILVDLINFQDYIIHNINQLKLFKYNITVIISDNLISHFETISNIKIVKTSELEDYNYNNSAKIDNDFRNGFWKLCSQRLFYLYSYIKQYNIINSLHIENDVMLYNNLEIVDTSKIWLTLDSNNRCIPGIVFIPSYDKLSQLINNYSLDKNDMENLAIFYHNNRDICETFPIIQTNPLYDKQDIFNDNFCKFNKVFDAAAMGQYLGGVDPRNTSGDSRGFVNESCVVDYSKYDFIWKLNIDKNIFQPYIIINNTYIPIFNLHIHSKNLCNFSSTNPLETKLIPIYKNETDICKITDFITGEKLQSIADIYLGLVDDFNYNPIIKVQTSKLVDLSTINDSYLNPYIIFCYAHRLDLLKSKLQYFQNQFILITHNSDENIINSYEELLYSNKIIYWYAQNVLIKHPKLQLLPIGIANSMWSHGNLNTFSDIINNDINKNKNFYFYFNISTNVNERQICKTELEQKGLVFGNNLEYILYLKDLSSYKFAICPPGNGIDSHRIWECYYLGVIPILLRSTFSEELENKLPCILLDKWSKFNENDILSRYDSLINKLNTNIKYLTYSHYYNHIKNAINI
jgi:hypothetical protein